MKILKIAVLVVAVLVASWFLLQEYHYRNAPKEVQILSKAESKIEYYMKTDMHDPSSLTVEYVGLPLALDTIHNKELFPYNQDYYLIRANCRGKNMLGAQILNAYVFYVTEDGICISSDLYKDLSSPEREWISEATMKSLHLHP